MRPSSRARYRSFVVTSGIRAGVLQLLAEKGADCFELHRQSILAKLPENERPFAETQLHALKYAFFTEPPELDKVKSGLEFFKAHPAALVRVQKLLREWVLERLVRRGGKEMQREYEGLVFGGN